MSDTPDLSHYCRCDTPLYWTGCYTQDARLKKLLDPKTTRHPAKMAPGLLARIFDHLTATGLLSPGTTIVDFMGGTGRTAVEATRRGYRAVTVELEPHFVEFQKLNKTATEKALGRKVDWDIRQGDARKLSEILSGGAGIVSPPYADSLTERRASLTFRGAFSDGRTMDDLPVSFQGKNYRYAEASKKDNIGNLKAGVVSPPYAEMRVVGGHNVPEGGAHRIDSGENGVRSGYSPNPNNIGNLREGSAAIVSPPYGPIEIGKGLNTKPPRPGHNDQSGRSATAPSQTDTRYSTNPNNIGNLPEGSMEQNEGYDAVTSPLYMDAQTVGGIAKVGHDGPSGKDDVQNRTYMAETHGTTEGQLGAQKPQTYWEAMQVVYTEAFRCGISPLVIVTKDPTRNRKIVPLGASTAALIEKIGYRIVCYHRAVLFLESTVKPFDGKRSRLKVKTRKEVRKHRQFTLIGRGSRKGIRKKEEVHVVTERRVVETDAPGGVAKFAKGRVSFFKHLSIAEGSPAARWEDVIIAVIPDGLPKFHTAPTSVTSHPYQQMVVDKIEPTGNLYG